MENEDGTEEQALASLKDRLEELEAQAAELEAQAAARGAALKDRFDSYKAQFDAKQAEVRGQIATARLASQDAWDMVQRRFEPALREIEAYCKSLADQIR